MGFGARGPRLHDLQETAPGRRHDVDGRNPIVNERITKKTFDGELGSHLGVLPHLTRDTDHHLHEMPAGESNPRPCLGEVRVRFLAHRLKDDIEGSGAPTDSCAPSFGSSLHHGFCQDPRSQLGVVHFHRPIAIGRNVDTEPRIDLAQKLGHAIVSSRGNSIPEALCARFEAPEPLPCGVIPESCVANLHALGTGSRESPERHGCYSQSPSRRSLFWPRATGYTHPMAKAMDADDRFMVLETKVAYQDKLIADLNDVIVEQNRTIEALERRLGRLEKFLAERSEDIDPAQEEPPHY